MIGILNEKPSQARNFAKALGGMSGSYNGEEYTIVPARGHLFGFINDPSKQVDESLSDKYKSWEIGNLPWNETDLKWIYGKKSDVDDALKNIKNTLSKCDEIVIATDDDPTGEGELLAWEVISLLKLNTKKYTRMFFADESEKEIQKAFLNRKLLGTSLSCMFDDPDYKQALFRTKWDYLSMQWTRIATKYSPYGQVPRQGRLKSVMVRIVGDQLDAIEKYVKKPFYQVRFKDENSVTYINEKEPTFEKKEDAPISKYHDSDVVCDSKTKKTTAPPKFLDLASLGGLLAPQGVSAETVLATYQRMYEAKVVSYPRTEDKCITIEQFNELLPLVDEIADLVGVDKKLLTHKTPRTTHVKTGMAHGANRPGPVVPSSLSDLDRTYGAGAEKIYVTLAKNYLATLCEDYEYEQQKGHVKDFPDFKGTANIPEKLGWKLVFDDADEKDENESSKGLGHNASPFVHEGVNPKPKAPTMKWLMKQLEKYDVGTGATRTSIYADVTNAKSKYPLLKETKGKITMQPNGISSYNLSHDTHIASLDLTEKVMKQMKMIYKGESDGKEFLHDVQQMIIDDMEVMKNNASKYNVNPAKERSVVGTCPICGSDVLEGEKGYYCSNWSKGCKTGIFKESFGLEFSLDDFFTVAKEKFIVKEGRRFKYDSEQGKLLEEGNKTSLKCPCCDNNIEETDSRYVCSCGFSIPKVAAGHTITAEEIGKLKTDKETDLINDFVSKTGKSFEAKLKLNGKKLEFEFKKPESSETYIKCPCCRKKTGTMKEQEKRYFCDCGFTVWKTIAGRKIEIEELRTLCANGETDILDGFQKKAGGEFSCKLAVNKKKKSVDFKFKKPRGNSR